MGANPLLESRKVKQRVRGYQPDVIDELLTEGASLRATQGLGSSFQELGTRATTQLTHGSSTQTGVSGRMPEGSLEVRRAAQRAQKQAESDAKHHAFREARQRKAQEAAKRKDAVFQRDYEEVLEGLGNSSGIMGDTRYTLEHKEKVKATKAVALHKEWTEQVFDVVQDRLQSAVDARAHEEVEARLRTQMDQYLHMTNTKLGVFRDVIIEADYDPLAAQAAAIRIPVGDIVDPLKRDVLKPQLERQLMGLGAEAAPLGKLTLDAKQWGTLLIGSTPYGHCIDKNGDYALGTMTQSSLNARESHVPMDHYTFARGPDATEVPKGKRILPVSVEAKQGRNGLYDVVQHTCGCNPTTTGGDRWLESKGKGMVPPPASRTTAAFAEVVQQQVGDAYKQPRDTMGDSWLDAKGKTRLAGPEVKRGRADLFSVVQQQAAGRLADSARPASGTGGTGDAWLEHKGKRSHAAPDNDLGRTVMTSVPQPLDVIRQRDPRNYMSHIVPQGGGLSVTD